MMFNVVSRIQLEAAFVQFAARPALTYQDKTWTYSELDARTPRCGGALAAAGPASLASG